MAKAELTTIEVYVVTLEVILRATSLGIAEIRRSATCVISRVTSLLGTLLTNNNKYILNSAII